MKRLVSMVGILVFLSSFLFAQTGAFQEATSDYYRIFSEVSLSHAQKTADMMDAYLKLYNNYLHFDLANLNTKLKVRIFANKTNFDSYLSTIIPQKRDSFVFLQYRDLEKSELLGFYMEDSSFQKAVVHHGSIQFMKAFIANPPLWLQKGIAVYLEKSAYNEVSQEAVYQDNLAWVKTIKSIVNQEGGAKIIQLENLLAIDADEANASIEAFYAESWALVSFLLNAGKHYNRMMWDTLSILDPEANMSDNSRAVASKVFGWVSSFQFLTDFQAYMADVKTFPELVREGMAYYSTEELARAEKSFLRAIEKNDKHDIPYYYLGLINYARKDYTLAEYYYLTSQQMGGEMGLTFYALGVNAYADNRFDDAKSYLGKASNSDPFGYGEKTTALLQKIEG